MLRIVNTQSGPAVHNSHNRAPIFNQTGSITTSRQLTTNNSTNTIKGGGKSAVAVRSKLVRQPITK